MADMAMAVAVSTVVSLQQITHPCPVPQAPTYLCNMADIGLAVAMSTVVSLQQITHPCPFPQPTCAIWRI